MVENPASEILIINLLNSDEKVIIHQKLSDDQTKMDLKGLAKGLYFYRITGTSTSALTGKIIVE